MPGDALETRVGLVEHRQVLGFGVLSTSLALMDLVQSLGLSSEHTETLSSHGPPSPARGLRHSLNSDPPRMLACAKYLLSGMGG